ncbi:MAG: hypothetical protein Q8K60_09825, partial [Parachlamydiaceae bacterium]|nr:hypothetical protein [Parachlamydiaceae bacterium]
HETILFEPETEKTTVCPIENEREETIKKFDELMYVERSSIYLEKANELKNKYYNKQNEFDDDSYQKFFTNDFLNKYEQFKNYVNNWNIEIRDQGLNDSINVYKINFKNNLLRFFNRTKDEDLNISQLKQVAQKYYLYQVRKNSIDILYRHYINKSPIHCFRFENDLHYDSNILEIIIKEKNECKYVELKVSKKNGYEKIKVDSSISSDTHLEVLFINKNEEFTLLESINKETLENLQQNFDKNSIVSQVNVEDIEHILEKNEENANNYVSAACKYLLNECQPYWLELKDENKGFEERILAMENLHNLYKWFNIRFNTIHKILNGNKIKTLLIGQDTFNNPNISNVKILKLKDQSLVLSFLVNENQIYISESSKLTLYKGFNKNKNSRMWYKKPTN